MTVTEPIAAAAEGLNVAIDSTGPTSRRSLLTGLFGGVAAAVAGSLGLARPARANDPNDVRLGAVNMAVSQTQIVNTSNHVIDGRAFTAESKSEAYGISGVSKSGWGVWGYSKENTGVVGNGFTAAGIGVHGSSPHLGVKGSSTDYTGEHYGVYGETQSPSARAVFGRSNSESGGTGVLGDSEHIGVDGVSRATSGEHYGIYGSSNSPSSRAIFGRSRSTTGGTGMWGQADTPGGVGVRGLAWNANNGNGGYGTAIIGSSGSQAWPGPMPNTGVLGVGKNGRGGVFGGDLAQVRLLPSTSPSHPAAGVVATCSWTAPLVSGSARATRRGCSWRSWRSDGGPGVVWGDDGGRLGRAPRRHASQVVRQPPSQVSERSA